MSVRFFPGTEVVGVGTRSPLSWSIAFRSGTTYEQARHRDSQNDAQDISHFDNELGETDIGTCSQRFPLPDAMSSTQSGGHLHRMLMSLEAVSRCKSGGMSQFDRLEINTQAAQRDPHGTPRRPHAWVMILQCSEQGFC